MITWENAVHVPEAKLIPCGCNVYYEAQPCVCETYIISMKAVCRLPLYHLLITALYTN